MKDILAVVGLCLFIWLSLKFLSYVVTDEWRLLPRDDRNNKDSLK